MNHESITDSLPISIHAVRRQPAKSAPIVLQSQEDALSREEPYLPVLRYKNTLKVTKILGGGFKINDNSTLWSRYRAGTTSQIQFDAKISGWQSFP
jgi:hypothetical protein